jgi:hypothetical protein
MEWFNCDLTKGLSSLKVFVRFISSSLNPMGSSLSDSSPPRSKESFETSNGWLVKLVLSILADI